MMENAGAKKVKGELVEYEKEAERV